MRREIHLTTHGGAPGKPEWREDIAKNLGHTTTAQTGDSISMDFGFSPSNKADEVRAMIVNEGSGSAVGGNAIHAGPPGRSVWDEDVSGKHPSRAKTEYDLPDEFNQMGNQFVQNAMRIMQTDFGSMVEQTLQAIPDSAYHGNVRVTEG